MPWGDNLSKINSNVKKDLHEYNSRPTDKVLELVSDRKDDTIVIYGATGKWMSDLTEMLLRAIQETGTTNRKVHLVSSFRRKLEFDERFASYTELFVKHEINLLYAKPADLNEVPSDAPWVIYGLGYKFRTTETDEEYARLCNLYGNDIPRMVFTHHRQGADIVVIGSGNGLALTPVDDQAKDDAPLLPKEGNHYGISIRDKERTVKEIIEDSRIDNASRAVILRGAYMTDLTYGGLESTVLAVLNDKEIDLGKLSYFNIMGHRDASVYAILSVRSAENPVTTLNLSGHTVDVRTVADVAGRAFGKTVRYVGKPSKLHLLMDGSKMEELYGPPIDTLEDMVHAQIFWIKHGGYSRGLDHRVGESM